MPTGKTRIWNSKNKLKEIYNKINGTIEINFGTHVPSDTKLRLYNATLRASLSSGREIGF
jgi:hypothetical protein